MKTGVLIAALTGLVFFVSPPAIAEQTPTQSANQTKVDKWTVIRHSLFKERDIAEDSLIILEAPNRAQDAAVVPISVKSNITKGAPAIKKLILVVDENPAPIVGTFTISDISQLAVLSTRIRVNAYSNVRAIAQTSDGKLHMATRFVKASGGCSAPAASVGDANKLGQMRLRYKNRENLMDMQLMINHPNASGMQIDQFTRNWIPADFVQEIEMSVDGQHILSFTGGISMSENPMVRITMKPEIAGTLITRIKDSQGRIFEDDWVLVESNTSGNVVQN